MGIEELIRKIDRDEARQEANQTFTKNLIINTDFSNEKIAMLVGVEVKYVAQMRVEMG